MCAASLMLCCEVRHSEGMPKFTASMTFFSACELQCGFIIRPALAHARQSHANVSQVNTYNPLLRTTTLPPALHMKTDPDLGLGNTLKTLLQRLCQAASTRSSRPHCLTSQGSLSPLLARERVWRSITRISSCAGNSLESVRFKTGCLSEPVQRNWHGTSHFSPPPAAIGRLCEKCELPLAEAGGLVRLNRHAAYAGLLRLHLFAPLPCFHRWLPAVQAMASV